MFSSIGSKDDSYGSVTPCCSDGFLKLLDHVSDCFATKHAKIKWKPSPLQADSVLVLSLFGTQIHFFMAVLINIQHPRT